MFSAARKLRLIKNIISVKDDAALMEVESLVKKLSKTKASTAHLPGSS